MHSFTRLYELPVYLPAGWTVKIRYDRLTLIAPNQAIAEALRLGAAQSLRATSRRLGVPVEIICRHGLYELPVYLPAGWTVKIRSDRLVLIAPNRAIAEALRLGAAQSLWATSQRLGVPVEILCEQKDKQAS